VWFLRVLGWVARWLGRLLAVMLLWLLLVQTVGRLVRRYWHFPVPPFVAVFLSSPLRRALQPTDELVDRAGIGPGMNVLELGPGPGTFTIPAARLVGETGRVVAVDIEPKMIEKLARAAEEAGLANIEPSLADAYNLPAPDSSVDVAFMVTVLAEIPDRQRALAELRRVVKPEGILSISEFLPDPDYPRRSTVIRWCEAAGFELIEEHGGLLSYTLNFRPA
jgi:ubiquinone/menaquinone biosynthesis C-methylase UbiE